MAKDIHQYESYKRAKKKYTQKTYKNYIMALRYDSDYNEMAALNEGRDKGIPYRKIIKDWYNAYVNSENAQEEPQEPDMLGIANMVLQLGGQDKLESMQESGELDRLRDMILSDSRVQLVTEEYVSNAVR